MAESIVRQCECFTGNPYFDENGVCRCTANVNTQPPIYNAPPKSPGSSIRVIGSKNNTDSIFSVTSIVDWVKAHPYIVAGAAGLLIYFLFIMRKRSR